MYQEYSEYESERSQPLTFHQGFRGACRFGLVASASCSLTLAARLIPMLMPVASIAAGGVGLGAIIYALWKRGDQSLYLALGLLSASTGVALGSWDGIAIFMATATASNYIAFAGVTVFIILAIAAERLFNRGGQQ